MKRTNLKYITAIPIIIILLLSYGVFHQKNVTNQIINNNKKLKSFELVDTEGEHFSFNLLNNNKPIIVVYFNSDCESCLYELNEIKNNYEAFKNATVLFISTEEPKTIKTFAVSLNLYGYSNIFFTSISENEMLSNLGDLRVPHILIYDSNRILQKEFKGETKAQSLLKYSGVQ